MSRGTSGRQDPARPRAPDLLAAARIVIVDDQESNVLLLDRLLRFGGARDVHGITDAREAVDRCLELRPDLVLLDLHMPHLDGITVLTRLLGSLPLGRLLPVIVLTADTTELARHRALEAGAKDFLTKPLERDEVLLRVRNHLETVALYARLQGENDRLQAELDHREHAARLAEDEQRRRRARIRHVLDRDGLEVVFQPVADLASGRIVAVEALARFRSAEPRGPDAWFAEAAAIGLGTELELAAVRGALRRLPDLPPNVDLNVNVSPSVAATDELADALDPRLRDRVVLELTEHVPVDDYGLLVDELSPLRADGVRVAVDDAGAGYAGLHHIVQLRPDVLKLDGELTTGIEDDPARRAMAASMVHFAREIEADLVAEGIENQAALDVLRQLGVELGQGYHLARPGLLPLEADRVPLRGTEVTRGR